MNKLFATKIWQSLWATLLFVLWTTTSANASGWELDGYYWSGSSETIGILKSPSFGDGKYIYYKGRNKESARNQRAESPGPIIPIFAEIIIGSGTPSSEEGLTKQNTAPTPTASVGSSVYAVFTWRRNSKTYFNQLTGHYETIPDPNDNPPSHIYVREEGGVSGGSGRIDRNGPNRNWKGDYFTITGSAMGVDLGGHKVLIRKIAVSNDQAVVPSRSFHGEIKLSSGYENENIGSGSSITSNVSFGYQADTLNFTFNASAPAVSDHQQTKPDTEEIDALVGLRWLHPDNLETGEDGEDKIVPSRDQARGFWTDFGGGGEIDDGAPHSLLRRSSDFHRHGNP